MGGRTLRGLERALDRAAAALFCSALVSGAAAGAAALLGDSPEWLKLAAVLQVCAGFGVFMIADLVPWITHVPRLEQAAAQLGFRPAALDIPAKRRPEHARSEVKNVFRGNWNGHHVRLFEFEFVWETTEHNHRASPLCSSVRVLKDSSAVQTREWELPGEWHVRLDGPWLFCWRVPQVDSAKGIEELLTTLAGVAERLPEQ